MLFDLFSCLKMSLTPTVVISRPYHKEAKKLGIDADGPIPPDTVFSKARGGQYDVVIVICVVLFVEKIRIK
ncbi:MAG TPA: hypothetical protein EYP18_10045 [Desulfobacterales bacterium]|nr:hypothetical protein [Desulfobacterales bacterium]